MSCILKWSTFPPQNQDHMPRFPLYSYLSKTKKCQIGHTESLPSVLPATAAVCCFEGGGFFIQRAMWPLLGSYLFYVVKIYANCGYIACFCRRRRRSPLPHRQANSERGKEKKRKKTKYVRMPRTRSPPFKILRRSWDFFPWRASRNFPARENFAPSFGA